MRRSLPLLALLACTRPALPDPPPPEPPTLAPLTLAPLTLDTGQVVELAVSADGHAAARLATPSGSERFVVILVSTRLEASSPPSPYTVSLNAAERLSQHRLVDGCSLSNERFATTALPTDPPPTGSPPHEGATRTLHVPTQASTETIDARALSVGEHAVIWADITHPTGLDQAFVLQFRDDFDASSCPARVRSLARSPTSTTTAASRWFSPA